MVQSFCFLFKKK